MNYIKYKKIIETLNRVKILESVNMDSLFGPVVRKELINEEIKIDLGFEKKIYKDFLNKIEVTTLNDIFIVISKFEYDSDIYRLRNLIFCKKPGIYIIFNNDSYYVGQSINMIDRFNKHILDEKMLLNNGRIIFFGREDDGIGKDQLDYMESYLIKRIAETTRSKINSNNGNKSHQSATNKICSDYILSTMYQTVLKSNLNPFVRQRNEVKEYLNLTFESYDSSISKVSSQYSAIISKKEKYIPRLVEFSIDDYGILRPVDIDDELAFYNSKRDGEIPEDDLLYYMHYLSTRYLARLEEKWIDYTYNLPKIKGDII